MRIGVIGSGNVGGTLGARWAQNGHSVIFATRSPESEAIQSLVAKGGGTARSGSSAEAVRTSDILLLATPWEAAQDVVRSAGDLSGKVLIDATNPLLPNLEGLSLGTNTSAAEQVAQWAPGAQVVKAFNTVGYNIMADANFKGHPVVMFYCGDHSDAKTTVASLISELGFHPMDAGPLKQARLLEPFALLWISLAYKQGFGREIGFEFLKR